MNYHSSNKIIALGLAVTAIAVISAAWTLISSADAAAPSRVFLCHCSGHECHTLHIPAPAAISHLSRHEDDYAGHCVEPTPSVTPSPSPFPTPTPTPAPDCLASTESSQSIVIDDFNGYTDGSVIEQGGWESYVNGSNFVIQGTVINEGTKALHNDSFGDSVAGKRGTSQTNGKQAVCFRTENRNNWGFYSADGNVGVRVSKGLNASGAPGLSFASVSLKQDGNVAYYDQVADVYSNFATYSDNEWTLLEIEWRSSDKTARYRVNSGIWTDWKPFANSASFTGFDYVNFGFVLPSGSGGVYFDTLR